MSPSRAPTIKEGRHMGSDRKQVLAVVQDQQQLPGSEVVGEDHGERASRRSRTPKVEATACGTREGSSIDASSTIHTPSSNFSTSSPAAAKASLVLPQPPGPVSVRRRLFSSRL